MDSSSATHHPLLKDTDRSRHHTNKEVIHLSTGHLPPVQTPSTLNQSVIVFNVTIFVGFGVGSLPSIVTRAVR